MSKLGVTPKMAEKYAVINVAEAEKMQIDIEFADDLAKVLAKKKEALLAKVYENGCHYGYDDFIEYCDSLLDTPYEDDFDVDDVVDRMREKVNDARMYYEIAKDIYGVDSEESDVMRKQVATMMNISENFNVLLEKMTWVAYQKLQIIYASEVLEEELEFLKRNANHVRENVIQDVKAMFDL